MNWKEYKQPFEKGNTTPYKGAYAHPGTSKKQLKWYNANVQNINANNNNHNNNKNNYENKSVQQLTRPSTSKERGGEKSTTREKKNE